MANISLLCTFIGILLYLLQLQANGLKQIIRPAFLRQGGKDFCFCSLSHEFDKPFFFRIVTTIMFTISPKIPLFNKFPLTIRKFIEPSRKNEYSFFSTKFSMANLFASLLRLAIAPCAYWSPLFAFTHNVRNVMRGHRLSLRHSVKHYETRFVLFIPIYII